MAFSIPVSATIQTAPPTTGTAATSLKPQKRTLSLTGTMGGAIVVGDIVAIWGSNDGGRTYQPLRQGGDNHVVQLNFYNPEVVIDDCCDHYATQRIGVGAGSALAAVGFNGEDTNILASPAWVQGGNAGFAPTGVLGTTDSAALNVIAEGIPIIRSDGVITVIGNPEALVPGSSLQLAAGNGTAQFAVTGVGTMDLQTENGTLFISSVGANIDMRPGVANAIRILPRTVGAGNTTQIQFFELAASGANFVSMRAPDALAADNAYVLPNAFPTIDGQSLRSTTLGVMSWSGGTVNVQANNTNAQSIADGAAAAIVTTWTEVTDSANAFDAATGIFTAPVAGFYLITAELEYAAIASIVTGEFTAQVFKAGALVASGVEVCQVAAANVKRNPKVTFCVQLAAADTIDIRASQNSGSGANLLTNVATRNFLSISLVG